MGNHSGKYDGILQLVKNCYSENDYEKFFFTVKFLIYFPLISNCIPVYYIYIYVYESFGCYELCFPISLFYFIHLNVSQRILAFSFVGVGNVVLC